jgi:hypothetical protein
MKAVKVVRPLYADFYEELYDKKSQAEDAKSRDFFLTNFKIPQDIDTERLDFVKSLLKGLNESMRDYAATFGINYSSNKNMFDKDFTPTEEIIEEISDYDENGGTFCRNEVFAGDGINVEYLIDNAAIYSTLYLTSMNISSSKKTIRDNTKAILVFYYNQFDHCLEIKALCANQIKRFPLAGSKIISFFINSVIYFLSKYPEKHIKLCVNSVPSAINFYKNNDFQKKDTSRLLTQTIGKEKSIQFSSLEPIDTMNEDISGDSNSEKEEESQLSLQDEGTQSSLKELEIRFNQASQESQESQESSLDFKSNSDAEDMEEILSENGSQRYISDSDLDLFNSSESEPDDKVVVKKQKQNQTPNIGGRYKTKNNCKKARRKSCKKNHRKTNKKYSKKSRRKTKKRNN